MKKYQVPSIAVLTKGVYVMQDMELHSIPSGGEQLDNGNVFEEGSAIPQTKNVWDK